MTRIAKSGIALNERCYVEEFMPPNKAKFVCFAKGHTFTQSVMPYQGRRRTFSIEGAAFFCRYWRKENGGVAMACPKCKKERIAA